MATREGLGPGRVFCSLFRNRWLVAIFQGLSEQLLRLVVSGLDLQGLAADWACLTFSAFISQWEKLGTWFRCLLVSNFKWGVISGTHPYFLWLCSWGTHLTWFGDHPNGCIKERMLRCYNEQVGLTTGTICYLWSLCRITWVGGQLWPLFHISADLEGVGSRSLTQPWNFIFNLKPILSLV